ncbi:MAG TPA: SAM-dependent methyltransferase, partial [Polyangia bacterium]|nr:SAM-dependent methyltransferase [Polyangia bacterium]
GLGLLSRDTAATATLVELQPRLAALARRNADDNGFGARVAVENADVTSLGGNHYDLVVANPPYRLLAEGPASPNAEVATGQHELTLTLAQLAAAMRRLLKPNGRAALVYPARRLGELYAALDDAGLRPLRLRCVHPRANEPANRILVEAHKGARGPLVIAPPLVIRDGDGYSAEAAQLLGD